MTASVPEGDQRQEEKKKVDFGTIEAAAFPGMRYAQLPEKARRQRSIKPFYQKSYDCPALHRRAGRQNYLIGGGPPGEGPPGPPGPPGEGPPGLPSDAFFTMAAIEQYIHQHYADPSLGTALISEEFKISTSYLARIFKADKGVSVTDYIHSVRTDAAKELLRTTTLSLDKVASKVGFSNRWVLIRIFKN